MNYSDPALFNLSKMYLCKEYIPGYVKYSYWSQGMWTFIGLSFIIGIMLLSMNWSETGIHAEVYRSMGLMSIMSSIMGLAIIFDL